MRFGTHGSKRIDLEKGTWFDHEAKEGGGVLDLIKHEKGFTEDSECFGWMEREGLWNDTRAKGLAPSDLGLFKPGSKEVAYHDYVDEAGNHLFQVVKYEPKDFRQRRRESSGWVWSVKGIRQVPYRLPDVLKALGNGHIVFIVEGEKDADAMWDRGQPATTNAGGVKKWRDELNQVISGADVVVIADNDSPGREHADDVASKLANVAARVRVLDLGKPWSACPPKGDISDFFQAGKTAEDLNAIVEQLPDWVAKGGSIGMSADDLCALEFAPQNYIVPGYIVEGLTLFAGKPKVGKSWLLLHAALAVGRGGFTLGDVKCAEGDVLYCGLEDNKRRLQRRLKKLLGIQAPPKRLRVLSAGEMPLLSQGGTDLIRAWIKQVKNPRLVVIDVLAKVRDPRKKDQGLYDADYAAVAGLKAIADEFNIAIVVVTHLRKLEAEDPLDQISSTTGLTGSVDAVMVLHRTGAGTVLCARGRDLEDISKAVQFNADACTWTVLGDAGETMQSASQGAILAVLLDAKEPMSARDVADLAGMSPTNTRQALVRMAKAGEVLRVRRGCYVHPERKDLLQANVTNLSTYKKQKEEEGGGEDE